MIQELDLWRLKKNLLNNTLTSEDLINKFNNLDKQSYFLLLINKNSKILVLDHQKDA